MRDDDDARLKLGCVEQATDLLPGASVQETLLVADKIYRFVTGDLPVVLRVTRGLIRSQDLTDRNRIVPKETGPVQITDTQQFDISVEAEDSKGFATSDTFSASSADEGVATVMAGSDGRTFTIIAGSPGSTVVTVSDGTLSATEAVDVVPGGVATITITEGAVVEQPPAA